jgi:hypothetical protein
MAPLRHTRIRDEAFRSASARLKLGHAASEVSDYSGEDGARITRRLLSGARRPTAIIYDNDVMAIAGLGVAQEMGLSVPQDLSIVGWDDSPLCRLVHPPLTALQRDIPAYGARAAGLLLDVIDGKPAEAVQTDTARLAPRASTAPPGTRARLFLVAALVPGVTTQVTTFQVVNELGLYNTRWSAIALFLGTDIIAIYISGSSCAASRPRSTRRPRWTGRTRSRSTDGSSCPS